MMVASEVLVCGCPMMMVTSEVWVCECEVVMMTSDAWGWWMSGDDGDYSEVWL